MLRGASFSYGIFFMGLSHFQDSFGLFIRWSMEDFLFLPWHHLLFCFVLTATKDHGGKMVMSLAFILLYLPILQGSGLQDNEAQTQTTVTSILEVTLPV